MKNKIVAVTGGGRGIGRNIARAFKAAGAIVVSIDRKADKFNADLSTPGAARTLIDEIHAAYGYLDVLVNNARSSNRSLLGAETEEEWDHEMAVNLKSAFFLAKYAMELMPEGSAIVNVGSITANFVSQENAAYQISKGACLQMTRVLAAMGAPKKIRCNAVLPGCIVQDEHRERYHAEANERYRAIFDNVHPLGRPGASDEVAKAVLFLAGDDSAWTTGASLVVDGGLTIQELAAANYKRMRG